MGPYVPVTLNSKQKRVCKQTYRSYRAKEHNFKRVLLGDKIPDPMALYLFVMCVKTGGKTYKNVVWLYYVVVNH